MAVREKQPPNAYHTCTVPTEDSSGRGALSLPIDLDSAEMTPMAEVTLASAGLKERQDLRRWVTSHPELIAPGLLLITTEFDRLISNFPGAVQPSELVQIPVTERRAARGGCTYCSIATGADDCAGLRSAFWLPSCLRQHRGCACLRRG
jgi:hypothetical protein